jgi:hypothetical protein
MQIYNSFSGCRNHSALHGGWDTHCLLGLQTQHQEGNGSKDSRGPLLLVVYFQRAGGIHVAKYNGSEWLGGLLKQGDIQSYANNRVKSCALGLPFARHVFHSPWSSAHPRSLETCLHLKDRKEDADCPGMQIVLF